MSEKENHKKIAQHLSSILQIIGENVEREGLLKTPQRAAESLLFLTQSQRKNNAETILKSALFTAENQEIIIVKDIEFYSLCEHHILPFFGSVHIAYIPTQKIVGLSKIPRMVDALSHKLQLQERLTYEIAQTLQKILQPAGVAVMIEAQHLCMMMRGIQKQQATMKTVAFMGAFEQSEKKKDFYRLIH